MTIRIVITGKLHKLEDRETFEAAFDQVSRNIISAVPGLLRDELIRDTSDPYTYLLVSEWKDKETWAAWQSAPIHNEQTGHLQNYWKGQGVKFYEVVFNNERTASAKK